MNYPVNYTEVTVNTEFHLELMNAIQEATQYLLGFGWCKEIKNRYIYLNLGSTLCIFLFEIENEMSIDDNYLWVIVGDIPPMYLDTHGPKTTKDVLEDYVKLANDWVEHVKLGKSIKDCYPFKAEPTIEMAIMLEKRATFIRHTLINNIVDIPIMVN